MAQDYTAGLTQFRKGQFAAAEKTFTALLPTTTDAKELAKLYKFIGICEYMEGKRLESAASFRHAKGLDASIKLTDKDIIDESILDFFASIPIPAPIVLPSPTSAAPLPEKKIEIVKAEKKKAWILVKSNVLAKVTIDNQLAGDTGEKLTVIPGAHQVQVVHDGYEKEVKHVEVAADTVHEVEVSLQKLVKKKKVKLKLNAEKETGEEETHTLPPKNYKMYYLLPFGIGQYINHSYFVGGVAAASQIGFAYLAWSNYQQAEAIIAETNTEVSIREQIANSQFTDEQEQQAYYQTQILDYQKAQNKKANEYYNNSDNALTAFVLSWVASILEAYLNSPFIEAKSELNAVLPPDRLHPESRFSLQVRSIPHTLSSSSPALLAGWKLDF